MAGVDVRKSSQEQLAGSRFSVCVVGGDAVFLLDRRRGHKLYMGLDKPLTRLELRDYVLALDNDLNTLETTDFLAKYGLKA